MVNEAEPGQEPEMVETEAAPADEVKTKNLDTILEGRGQEKEPKVPKTDAGADTPPKDPEKAAKPKEDRGPKWYREGIERANREAAEARRKAEELERRLQQGQPQAPQYVDPIADPQAFYQTFEQRMQQVQLVQRLEFSEMRAADKHGPDVVDETRAWLTTRPDMEQWAMSQRDPWNAAIAEFKKIKLAEEIGDDPNAWRESERERLRRELMEEMQFSAPEPTMRPRTSIPAPASASRSASPRGNQSTGPTPLGQIVGTR